MKYQDQFVDSSLSSERPAFVKKVYGILTVQLTATTLVTVISRIYPAIRALVNSFQIVALIAMIVSVLALTLGKQSKKVPTNFILLGVFTLSESISLAAMTQFVRFEILACAFAITASVSAGLTLHAMTTKKDLTIIGATGWIILSSSLALSLILIFTRNDFIHYIYLLVGAISYGYYLVIDTQMIMGGKRGKFDIDDYILASLNLYMDIIQMLIYIVQILQKGEEEKKNKNKK